MKRSSVLGRVAALLLLLLLLGQTTAAATSPAAEAGSDLARAGAPDDLAPAVPVLVAPNQTAPEELIVETTNIQDHWTYGGTMLYWRTACYVDLDPRINYLRRRAENGSLIQTIEVGAPGYCGTFSANAVADAEGVYHVNVEESQLIGRPAGTPAGEIVLASISLPPAPVDPTFAAIHLAIDEDRVYYNQPTGIFRAAKDAYGGVRASDAISVAALAVDDTYIYWIDNTGLWRSDKTCTSAPCWDDKEQLVTRSSSDEWMYLTWGEEGELLFTRASTSYWYIMHVLSNGGGSAYYSSPKTTTAQISKPVVHDGTLYWLENLVAGSEIVMRRKVLPSGPVETIAEGLEQTTLTWDEELHAGAGGILFGGKYGIFRLPFDAPPVVKDLALFGWEVTQAIQSLNNDVPLVADKPTYVRVFSALLDGGNANSAQVELRGYRGGSELPGSPLQPMQVPPRLVEGEAFDREKAWTFHLPASWIDQGTLHLEAEIDPRDIYSDGTPGNNALSGDFYFEAKDPICLRFMAVHTHAPRESMSNPYFWPMIAHYMQLWPVSEVRTSYEPGYIEELEFCWLGPLPWYCWGPYEMPDDSPYILTSLGWHDFWGDDPNACSRTLYIGMVHADTDTHEDENTVVLGTARLGWDQSWFKFPKRGDYGSWLTPGDTMAHELSHNYNRLHVPCGVTEDLDPSYPYSPTGWLDDGALDDPATHFGFDGFYPHNPTLLSPQDRADIMSYCRPQWVSDYTWNAMFNRLPGLLASGTSAAEPAPSPLDLAQDEYVVLAGGLITASQNQGALDYTWRVPTPTLSAGMLAEWQELAVPSVSQVTAPPVTQYSLRLLDANGAAVDQRAFVPVEAIDAVSPTRDLFFLTFPAPVTDVAAVELLIWGDVVDSLYFGPGTPSVQLLQPAGGEVIGQELTVAWQASDADANDRLRFTVQYSGDGGQTWQSLATNIAALPNTATMTLTFSNLDSLAESANAVIRVTASDGYHTGMATSASFQVSNRAPQAYILSPLAEEWVEAGQSVVLQGGASDAEDGNLAGSALSWTLDGQAVGSGAEVTLGSLAPGEYAVALTAQDTGGLTAMAQSTLHITPLDIRWVAGEPAELDGYCDEEFYGTHGTLLFLEPYADGSQAMVRLLRTSEHLWACFSGLDQAHTTQSFASLFVDVDHSQDTSPQPDDYVFSVTEDGTPQTRAGDGSAGPGGLVGVVSTHADTWNAELRIDAAVLGGWDHVVGLMARHAATGMPDYVHWPYGALWNYPSSWATTALGLWPALTTLVPEEAPAGSPGYYVLAEGSGFDSGAVVLWNGQPLTTAYIGSTALLFQLEAQHLATAGTAEVTVRNPGLEEIPSNALTFRITNPYPQATALDPISTTAGGPGLTLSIHGSGFVPGATVLWNGEERAASVVSSTLLTVAVTASDIAMARTVGVVVVNPEPVAEGFSEPLFFDIVPVEIPFHIYLPLLLKRGGT